MKPRSTLLTLIIASSLALSGAAHAVVLFSGDFTGYPTDIDGTDDSLLNNASTYLSSGDPAISGFSSAIDTAGSLFGTGTDAGDNGILTPNAELQTNPVWSFTFTTTSPLEITSASIDYTRFGDDGAFASGGGWDMTWAVEVFDGGSSLGSFSETSSGDPGNTNGTILTANLSGGSDISVLSAGTYTFEIQANDLAADSRSARFGVESFEVSGTVIPEPSSASLFLGVLAGVLLLRRRRA